MGRGDFAEGATDFRRAVQDQPPAHAHRGAGVDRVEQRRTEEVGAVDGRHEVVVRGVGRLQRRPCLVVQGFNPADQVPHTRHMPLPAASRENTSPVEFGGQGTQRLITLGPDFADDTRQGQRMLVGVSSNSCT